MSSGASYGSCSYSECPNSYSTDSHVTFFKFPLENPRRKKWIDNCGNPEIAQLSDRQLRGRRLCSDHFENSAFTNQKTKEALSDKAIPIVFVPGKAETTKAQKDAGDDADVESPSKKRKPGRPPKTPIVVKKEVEEEVEDDECVIKLERKSKTPLEVTQAKTQDKPEKETELSTPVKRGRGRPPKKSIPIEVVDSDDKIKAAEGVEVETPSTDENTMGAAESSEVPDIAPILSGRKLRGKRPSDAETLVVTKDTSVKVVPILDTNDKPDVKPDAKRGRGRPSLKKKPFSTELVRNDELRAWTKVTGNAPPLESNKRKYPPAKRTTASPKRIKQDDEASTSVSKDTGDEVQKNDNSNASEKTPKVGSDAPAEPKPAVFPSTSKPFGDVAVKTKIQPDGKRRFSEAAGFEKLHELVKQKCKVFDKFCVSGVMFDPIKKLKMMSITEMCVTDTGTVELKRNIQVFEDFSMKVLIYGTDMTKHFDSIMILGEKEIMKLVTRVSIASLCCGISNFTAADSNRHPNSVKRGSIWYSSDCPLIISMGSGNICSSCYKLRGSHRRRRAKDKAEDEKRQKLLREVAPGRAAVKSKFVRSLYARLEGFLKRGEERANAAAAAAAARAARIAANVAARNAAKVDNLPPVKNVDAENSESHIQTLEGETNKKNKSSSRTPASAKPKPKRSGGRQKKNTAKMNNSVITYLEPATPLESLEENEGTEVVNSDGIGQVVYTSNMLEHYVGVGENNIIIQDGAEFTLADGQEYELIGEAEPNSSGSHSFQHFSNDTYEIVEVDDQTMAQFAAQNGGMFLPDASNLQVTQLDPNDPSHQHFIKVLTPGEYYEDVSS